MKVIQCTALAWVVPHTVSVRLFPALWKCCGLSVSNLVERYQQRQKVEATPDSHKVHYRT